MARKVEFEDGPNRSGEIFVKKINLSCQLHQKTPLLNRLHNSFLKQGIPVILNQMYLSCSDRQNPA